MYRVYADSNLIYADSLENLKIIKPVVTLEVNKTGSFKFTIYPDHPYYSSIKKLKTIIEVYQDSFLIFKGRVLNDDLGFRNEKNIECEGDLAFFNDSIQRPYSYSGSIEGFLENLITSHNSQVDDSHSFELGNVTVTDNNNTIARSSIDYTNTWTVINEKLIKTLGGYIQVRHENGTNYIDYLNDFTTLASQKVEFAKNLLDLKRIRKGENIATALIPLGAKIEGKEERLTIESVNQGKDYIYNAEAVAKYGWIFATNTWDDVTVALNLKEKAAAHLGTLVSESETIELTAADLASINKKVDSFRLGTYVQVTSNPHGINQTLLVTKLTINLMQPGANKLTLGGVVLPFTERAMGNNGSTSAAGKDGASLYTWIKYSQYADGTDMTDNPAGALYIGIAYNQVTAQASTNKADYSWSRIRGEQGEPGEPGEPGKDAALSSDTPPTDTTLLWIDTTQTPPVLKRYNTISEEWEAYVPASSLDQAIAEVYTESVAEISKSSDEITSYIAEKYYSKEMTDELLGEVYTNITQTSEDIRIDFGNFQKEVSDIESETESRFANIQKYIRFVDGNIVLGEVGNELELQITKERISFFQNNNEVAYFSDSKLYVKDMELKTDGTMQLGNFAFKPRDNGNLSFKKIT